MDAETRRRVDEARARPPVVQLALTVALEHFTAIMAHSLLTERQPLPGAPEEIAAAVAMACDRRDRAQGGRVRHVPGGDAAHVGAASLGACAATIMALVSLQFWYSNFQRMADFFRQDGMNTPRTWWRVAKYLLVKPGMMRRIFWDYLRFYGPGFHPWHRDDRKLIAAIERSSSSD